MGQVTMRGETERENRRTSSNAPDGVAKMFVNRIVNGIVAMSTSREACSCMDTKDANDFPRRLSVETASNSSQLWIYFGNRRGLGLRLAVRIKRPKNNSR